MSPYTLHGRVVNTGENEIKYFKMSVKNYL